MHIFQSETLILHWLGLNKSEPEKSVSRYHVIKFLLGNFYDLQWDIFKASKKLHVCMYIYQSFP